MPTGHPSVAGRWYRLLAVVAFLPWLLLLGWMAETAWFLTDDAFISFRYARNLLEGHGLVFNPGERVEGYSNFLWVLELAALWGAFGLRPEVAAPWLSVAFTAGTLAAMAWWIARLPALRQRGLVAWMALGLVCASATFAVWTSGGGLETRQFTFFAVLAVACLAPGGASRGLLAAASLSLAAASLTRPEGPLLAACCFAWYGAQRRLETGRWLGMEWAFLVVPCALVVAGHYLFRYGYYGEWLPNTYYAKFVRPWYEMGWRYLAAAALETGFYLLAPLAVVALAAGWRRRSLAHGLPLLCVGAHMVYVARLGGDHFEWRPLDFYWPLLAVPAAEGVVFCARWVAAVLRRRLRRPFGYVRASRLPMAAALAVALFCPVLFYANALQAALLFEGAKIDTRIKSLEITVDASSAGWLFAAPGMERVNGVAEGLRSLLIRHWVGTRFAEHREFAALRLRQYAPYGRVERGLIPADAVTAMPSTGVAAFYLPDLTVVDALGLTDAAVARNPFLPNPLRLMAHDRGPPAGYLAARGVNFFVNPARELQTIGDRTPSYALEAAPGVWMPFDAPDHEWVMDRFDPARLRSYVDPSVANGNLLVYRGGCYVGVALLLQFEDGVANWRIEDDVFNHNRRKPFPHQHHIAYNIGLDFLTTFHPATGDQVEGRALSPEFTAAADALLSFRIAGGDGQGVGLRLLADGEQAAVWRGFRNEQFRRIEKPLAEFAGKRLQLELFDHETGGWGHVMLNHVLIMRPATRPGCPSAR